MIGWENGAPLGSYDLKSGHDTAPLEQRCRCGGEGFYGLDAAHDRQ